mmetsp:Transcript_68558/g.142959  ORF Transcript_68558/g.142959 Transcript_68558/m.142959 type:complete len:871 (-) Transcript_68558:513-3125(-)|eukprot:CAMPEP_0181336908 /NCGR_PEP_ID=MMETSP1101-20121128/27702_1 /TAXON_ID=46948 /ORGANISM="Rhodomonas abbreviata, Strain Caron Lab Isolate" /LENGTH=870 /DNA_ID=CAMNT_0023447299 /DNA_START=208 /DNA_END=2820 /DNA_ORIENTATION=+
MIVDGLNDDLRWDDLRELVSEELTEKPAQMQQSKIYHDASSNVEQHHQYIPGPATPSVSYMPLAAPPRSPRYREERMPSDLMRHAEHDWMQRNGGRAHEWHSGNWYATPTRPTRPPALGQRQFSAPQESHGIVWRNGNALEEVGNRDSCDSPIASPFYHRNHGRSSFQETKSKSTGSFYVQHGESDFHNLFYGESSAYSGAYQGSSATEEQCDIEDGQEKQNHYGVVHQLEEPASEPVQEVRDVPNVVPTVGYSEPSGASAVVQPRVYRPNRLYTLSQRNQEHLRAKGTAAPPSTPKRPVVHAVSRIASLKDRIDQQIKDFEMEFDGLSGLSLQAEPDEQELSGQASADPNCVKDQLLLIGEEETPQPVVGAEPSLSLVCEEKTSSREGAMSPSSREVFIPMLQAEALDDGDSYCESSNATSTSEHSPFSESSGQVVSMRARDWNDDNNLDRGEGDIMPSRIDEQQDTIIGDVGISVIVEVGSGAGFLRVSDVAPDSSAEASGDVRRGDIVISADGTDLTGSEAVLRGWKKTIQGAPGTSVSLCLMDPNDMRPRSMKLRRTPQDLTPVKMFAERQRQLVMSLQALGSDPRIRESLQTTIERMRAPVSSRIPKVLVIGARGHGRTSLITSLLSIVRGGGDSSWGPGPGRPGVTGTRPAALGECGLKRGQAPLGAEVGAIVSGVSAEQQPMQLVAACAVDELETQQQLEDAFGALMTGRYLPRERYADWRARLDAGEDTAGTGTGTGTGPGPVHAVVLVHDCRIEPRAEVLRAVRAVSRDCGGVPVVVAVTKMEEAALYCTDVEGMVSKMASTLPKASFFPVAVGGEGDSASNASTAWAVMELFERVRSVGVHHAMHGHREASWLQSCDFVM